MKSGTISWLPAVGLAVAIVLLGCGCVSKATADARARQAYMAGQQQATERMRMTQGPGVTLVGPVAKSFVPWVEGLTLAKALVEAQYLPPGTPNDILIVRRGQGFHVDPAKLLAGEDSPLEEGDVIRLAGP